MIFSPKKMLLDASNRGYAVPAFNYYNLDVLFSVIEAAEEEEAPIIVQLYSPYYPFLYYEVIAKATIEALGRSKACSYFHLDHATDYQTIMSAIKNGFTSVMVDGSALPLNENISLTKTVVDVARGMGTYTEAELGYINRAGEENLEEKEEIAKVDECVRLIEETGVDSLAPAVGTAHGFYKKPPKINFERIKAIRAAVNVPIVLHGGSGTPDDLILRAIECGISKINVGTELKHCWAESMKENLEKGEVEPRILSKHAREQVKVVAKNKIRLFGAAGKMRELVKRAEVL